MLSILLCTSLLNRLISYSCWIIEDNCILVSLNLLIAILYIIANYIMTDTVPVPWYPIYVFQRFD